MANLPQEEVNKLYSEEKGDSNQDSIKKESEENPIKKFMGKVFGLFFVVVIIYGLFFSDDPSNNSETVNRSTYIPTTRNSQTFYGFDCTDDCSGHQAGWDWAESKNIYDPNDCGGKSQSFIEGCAAYAMYN